jgi:membrane associated rhomboid family serine protease
MAKPVKIVLDRTPGELLHWRAVGGIMGRACFPPPDRVLDAALESLNYHLIAVTTTRGRPIMVMPLGDESPTRIVPVVNYAIIALNILVTLLQQARPESFTIAYSATPYEITHNVDIDRPVVLSREQAVQDAAGRVELRPEEQAIPQAAVPFPVWFTLLTSIFMHGGLAHLAGNMLYLWIFGDNVEEVLGHVRYLFVYLACGLCASLAHIALAPDSLVPSLGASGAIAGVMGMYVIWFPYNRVRVLALRTITLMPALVVIGLWIVMQLVLGMGSLSSMGQQGGVAYAAHVGGAAAGILFGIVYKYRARALEERPSDLGWAPRTYRAAYPTDRYR